jgi:hypothetical protein
MESPKKKDRRKRRLKQKNPDPAFTQSMPNIERPLSRHLARFGYFQLAQFLNPHGRRRNGKSTRGIDCCLPVRMHIPVKKASCSNSNPPPGRLTTRSNHIGIDLVCLATR